MKLNILVIEDCPYFRKKITSLMNKYPFKVWEAERPHEALNLLNKLNFHMAIIDLNLHGKMAGLSLLKETKKRNIFSIILTDNDDPRLVRSAYLEKCDHYLSKDHFEKVIDRIVEERCNSFSNEKLKCFLKNEFITKDPRLLEELSRLSLGLFLNPSILIMGETGVGKGVLAQFLHNINSNKKNKFISINVSAVPENLIESEFFGHLRGSFTGALDNCLGKLQLADNGTLFLDEIASMPLNMQKKLLKALEEKTFYPIGSSKMIYSNFQLISATCENIYQKISEDGFRKDLFHRINGLLIKIPPLRLRKDDIPLLIEHFMKKFSRKIHISDKALITLQNYNWYGNVRELKTTIYNFINKQNGIIDFTDLPEHIRKNIDPFKLLPSQELLNEGQFEYLKNLGLKEYIRQVEKEALRMAKTATLEVANHTMKILKLSHASYYRLNNRYREAR